MPCKDHGHTVYFRRATTPNNLMVLLLPRFYSFSISSLSAITVDSSVEAASMTSGTLLASVLSSRGTSKTALHWEHLIRLPTASKEALSILAQRGQANLIIG